MQLQNIINQQLIGNIIAGTFVVKEPDTQAQLREVTIQGLPQSLFVYTTDAINPTTNLKFKNDLLEPTLTYINQNCDVVFVWQDANEIDVLFGELKSESPSGYETQLINSTLFFDYIVLLFNCFFAQTPLVVRNKWYVLFYFKHPLATHKSIRGGNNSNNTLMQMVNPQAQGVSILKCAFSKSHHNYLKWSEMEQDLLQPPTHQIIKPA